MYLLYKFLRGYMHASLLYFIFSLVVLSSLSMLSVLQGVKNLFHSYMVKGVMNHISIYSQCQ